MNETVGRGFSTNRFHSAIRLNEQLDAARLEAESGSRQVACHDEVLTAQCNLTVWLKLLKL